MESANLTLLIFLICYAVITSFILVIKALTNESTEISSIKDLTIEGEMSDEKRIEFLLEIEKYKQSIVPWFMKTLSTIGVISFFSMIIATSVQTIKASIDTKQVATLEHKLTELSTKELKTSRVIKGLSDVVIELYARTGELSGKSKSILEYRLEELQLANNNISEQYNISMLLGKFRLAIDIITKNKSLLNDTNLVDQVNLAQYYYLLGKPKKSYALANKLKQNISMLPIPWQTQLLVLEYVLEVNKDKEKKQYIHRIQRLLKKDFVGAELFLNKETNKLMSAAIELK